MVDSGHFNKIMVRVVTPTLREIGFTRFRGREAWRYLDDPIWVFELKAVGPYFSTVTGFPPASLTARMSIFYLDFPDTPPCEVDKDGRLIPKESRCHVKYGLDNIQDQTPLRSTQMTPLERSRKDIWWIEPDGGNVETVRFTPVALDQLQECTLRQKTDVLREHRENAAHKEFGDLIGPFGHQLLRRRAALHRLCHLRE